MTTTHYLIFANKTALGLTATDAEDAMRQACEMGVADMVVRVDRALTLEEWNAATATQEEAEDIGMTREQASRINATADTREVGELSDVIADVVWDTDLDADMIEIAVDMACRQAGM